jgi:hypothetical protein
MHVDECGKKNDLRLNGNLKYCKSEEYCLLGYKAV